jgi:hypothetical protein
MNRDRRALGFAKVFAVKLMARGHTRNNRGVLVV